MQIRRQGWATLLSSTCTRAVKHRGGLWMSVQPPDCKAELMARTEQGHARGTARRTQAATAEAGAENAAPS